MIPSTDVVSEPVRVESRLAELGVPREVLADSVRAGRFAQGSTTRHHPSTAGGYYRWAEGFATLCHPLADTEGGSWSKIEIRSLPMVVNYRTRLALTVSGGNGATGLDPDFDPAGRFLGTARAKGNATKDMIEDSKQLSLVMPDVDEIPKGSRRFPEGSFQLYFLLSHEDADGVVRYELARPWLMDHNGNITHWSERIILGELPDAREDARGKSEPDSPIIPEVSVTRKAT